MIREYLFASFPAAAEALVEQTGRLIARDIARKGAAVFAVGGGRTPRYVLPRLAARECGWDKLTVTLTDDRRVDVDSPDSNEGLVRRCLIRDRAAVARVFGLGGGIAASPPTPDIVYLGFGVDGHVASLFPGGPELQVETPGLVAATAPVAPFGRISMTLPSLLAASHIVMLVSGAAKHRVYSRARRSAAAAGLPLARILRQTRVPVSVFMDAA